MPTLLRPDPIVQSGNRRVWTIHPSTSSYGKWRAFNQPNPAEYRYGWTLAELDAYFHSLNQPPKQSAISKAQHMLCVACIAHLDCAIHRPAQILCANNKKLMPSRSSPSSCHTVILCTRSIYHLKIRLSSPTLPDMNILPPGNSKMSGPPRHRVRVPDHLGTTLPARRLG